MKKAAKKKTGQPADAFVDRIVGQGHEDPARLRANPSNWRTHSEEQREAMRELLKSVGWVQRVIVNKRTGNLLDGHLRVEEALKRLERKVPVVYVDLSAEEERKVLATFDPISAMAGIDKGHLHTTLEGLAGESVGLEALLADLRARVGVHKEKVAPEVSFAEELLEEHNYVVLYFDNSVDWLYLQSLFPLAPVKSLRSKGKFMQIGQGRVVRGVEFLRKILGESA